MLQKIQNRIDGMTDLFEFFFSNEWLFESGKVIAVYKKLSL